MWYSGGCCSEERREEFLDHPHLFEHDSMPMILLLTMMILTLLELFRFDDGRLVRGALVVAHDVAELLLADVLQ